MCVCEFRADNSKVYGKKWIYLGEVSHRSRGPNMFCFLSHWYTSRRSHHSRVRSAMKFLYFTHLSHHQCKTFFLKFTQPLRQESRDTKFHLFRKTRHGQNLHFKIWAKKTQLNDLINFNHIVTCQVYIGLWPVGWRQQNPQIIKGIHDLINLTEGLHAKSHRCWGLLDGEKESGSDMISFVLIYDMWFFEELGKFATQKCKRAGSKDDKK